MKTINPFLAALGLGLLAALPVSAQTYDLSWFTIAGGGGTSTGSVYSVSGTIGQPAAGTLSGGNYTLVGGFWGIVSAVQTPGAPFLSITSSGGKVTVSWPSTAPDFALQQNNSLGSVNWNNVPPANIVTNGTNLSLTITTPTGNTFFRLKK
jgi:hypothetical protein